MGVLEHTCQSIIFDAARAILREPLPILFRPNSSPILKGTVKLPILFRPNSSSILKGTVKRGRNRPINWVARPPGNAGL